MIDRIMSAFRAFLESILAIFGLGGTSGGNPPPRGKKRTLIWSDEFNGRMSDQWHFFTGRHRHGLNTTQNARVENNKLKMWALPKRGGLPETSYLRTWNDKNMGDNPMLIDPTQGDIYIETSVNFHKAGGSQGAWWAFWLFSPDNWNERQGVKWDQRLPRMEPYDGNANTGMEVDILEYAPWQPEGKRGRRNGFNCAAYIGLGRKDLAMHPRTPDGFGYFYDINDYIQKPIDLTADKFHTIGFRQTQSKYEFFIEGQKYWEITDPRFITRTKSNALIMSWEIEDGLWGERGPTFNQIGKPLEVQVDYVRIYREQ